MNLGIKCAIKVARREIEISHCGGDHISFIIFFISVNSPMDPQLGARLRWDRLGVFSYTKILLIFFFKKRLFYPTWLGSILEKRVAEISEPALRKQFPLKNAATIASEIHDPAVNVEFAALISD